MRILIVGLGSIGRRHLANLRRLEPTAHITVCRRPSAERGMEIAGVDEVYGLEEALGREPQAALITGPASQHVPVAHILAEHGIHLFIEKPLSNNLLGVQELLDLCRQRSLVAMIGYNLRFLQSLGVLREIMQTGKLGRLVSIRAEVGQYLPDWRPGQDYRQTVSARRELGGGAVLELSHELDYVRWLVGEVQSVYALMGKLSELELDLEDTAEILLTFETGVLGSIHMDMVQRSPTRTCRVVGTEATAVWDGLTQEVHLLHSGQCERHEIYRGDRAEMNHTYVEELSHFLACVRGGQTPRVNLEEGRRVLEIALAAKLAAQEKRELKV